MKKTESERSERALRIVALVTGDDSVRLAAARAFDSAPIHWGLRFFDERPPHADHVVFGPDCEAGLEPRFDPADPATLLPPVASGPEGAVIGVVSAVGGSGVTTLALHLAAALSRDSRALLIEPPGRRALSARVAVPDDAAIWETGASLDVSIPIVGGSSLLRASDLTAALKGAAESGRVAVADLDATPDEVADLVRGGRLRTMVVAVPPTRPAARLTRDLLQLLGEIDRIIVTNRTGHGGDMTAGGISAVLGAPVGLHLPYLPSLRAAEDSALLVQQPWSRWWRGVVRLASTLAMTWTR